MSKIAVPAFTMLCAGFPFLYYTTSYLFSQVFCLDVTVAWYADERHLHLQIGEHEAEFFKVWGTNIDTEMDVDFLKPDNYLMIWEWLIDESQ